MPSPSLGHQYGAEHAEDVLGWCERIGISHVTVFMCSTENLARRDPAEVAFLMRVIEQFAADRLSRLPSWSVHVAGDLDVLPDSTARALKQAVETSENSTSGRHLTLAVGYGGRQEVIEAFRALLYEHVEQGGTLTSLADELTTSDIARPLYTAGQPDPDLVVRTSGEQRLSNFLLWQNAYSELYFCEAYWPAFREIDFLRALVIAFERWRHLTARVGLRGRLYPRRTGSRRHPELLVPSAAGSSCRMTQALQMWIARTTRRGAPGP